MPRLSAIAQDTVPLSIPLGGGQSLAVEYRPAILTPALVQKIQATEQTGSISDGLLGPVANLLASWDLTDDDDRPIPITPDGLTVVPLIVLLHVLTAIVRSTANAASPTQRKR